MSKKYSIVSLFCGAGGLDLGFHNSGGFKTIWANDFNKDATETMKKWCKDAKVVCGDITKIPNVLIPKADVFLGGFPCFVKGTLVNTSRGMIPIEEVVKGDMVLTHKDRYKKVITTMFDKKNGIHSLKILGATTIECTDNHPFMVMKKASKSKINLKLSDMNKKIYAKDATWVSAKNIEVGDYICANVDTRCENIGLIGSRQMLLGYLLRHGYLLDDNTIIAETPLNNAMVYEYSPMISDFKDNNKGRYLVIKSDFVETIEVDFEKFKASDYTGAFSIGKEDTSRLFKLFCEASKDKGVSDFSCLLQYSCNAIKNMLDGYFGEVDSKNNLVSEEFENSPDGIKRLNALCQAILKGYKCGYRIETTIEGTFKVVCSMNIEYTHSFEYGGKIWFPVRENKFNPNYSDYTYNIEVEDDNSYTVNNMCVKNCQGFSVGGNMMIDDPRNRLYKEYVRILKHVQPYCFIGENVIGLTIMDNGSVIDQIIKDFSDAGYNVTYDIVNAVDFGVAQDRERIIITGYRKDLDAKFPRPELCEHKTMRDVLLGLPEPKEDEIHMGGFSPRFMTSNRVRSWNEPSYTILAGGRNCPLHPSSTPMVLVGNREWQFGSEGKTRRLSYREAAVIQSFPYDFEFVGNLESKYKQVGNAVPPLLGEAYAKEIYKELRRLNLKGHINEF